MAAAVVVSVVARTASVSIVLGLESVVLGVERKRESTVVVLKRLIDLF